VFLLATVETSAQAIPVDFVVTLGRTGCFGSCPAYRVSIDAQGNVSYDGGLFVRVSGNQKAVIPASRVADIVETIGRIGFFDLRSEYKTLDHGDGTATTISDAPTTIVSVTLNGRQKQVTDYFGTPASVRELERLIDDAAGTKRWIRVDAATLESMLKQQPAPPVEQQLEMLAQALLYNDADVIKVFFANGMAPGTLLFGEPLINLARSGEMVRELVAAGVSATVKPGKSNPLLRAAHFDADLARALIEAGVPVDATVSGDGRTPLRFAACLGNGAVVETLLAAGANPDHRSNDQSPLECAQKSRALSQGRRSIPETQMFAEDYDRVIELLTAALARRKIVA
jgi:hypothetical protein